MYRPSPQIPNPSLNAAEKCYEASIFNIALQKKQIDYKLIDVTWIFTQAIFAALNAVLWCLSYQGIRQAHPVEEVKVHIQNALKAIDLCADRWPGVRSAQQLYDNLILGCLRAYDNDMIFASTPSDHASPISTHEATSSSSRPMHSPASTAATSLYGPQSPQSMHGSGLMPPNSGHSQQSSFFDQNQNSPIVNHDPMSNRTSAQAFQSAKTMSPQSPMPTAMHYSLPGFELPIANHLLSATSQSLPQWNPAMTTTSMGPGYMAPLSMPPTTQPWLATIGDEYSQYMHQAYAPNPYQMKSLSEQQQSELMDSLTRSQLPDVSNLVSDSTTFYTAYLP